jgi:hypothetical protein
VKRLFKERRIPRDPEAIILGKVSKLAPNNVLQGLRKAAALHANDPEACGVLKIASNPVN